MARKMVSLFLVLVLLLGTMSQVVSAEAIPSPDPSGFYFNQNRCSGCGTCIVACKDYNQVNPGAVRWRNQQNHEDGKSVFENLSMSCNHCEEPACVAACPEEAIEKSRRISVKYTQQAGKATHTNPFIRKCLTADPCKTPYENRLTTGNRIDEEAVRYAISQDGYNYKALNHNHPVIDSKTISSTGGVRDPHILRCEDGKTFYMV